MLASLLSNTIYISLVGYTTFDNVCEVLCLTVYFYRLVDLQDEEILDTTSE